MSRGNVRPVISLLYFEDKREKYDKPHVHITYLCKSIQSCTNSSYTIHKFNETYFFGKIIIIFDFIGIYFETS